MDSSAVVMPLIGGALIGLAASALLLFNGRILGVSGIFGGLVKPGATDRPWRAAFLAGLVAGGLLLVFYGVPAFPAVLDRSPLWLLASGLLVGFGTRMANGCTSGHGVCGISRLSLRSIAATAMFVGTGAATVYLVRHVFGA